MSGRFIAVVGPSGVGKDSLMAAMVAKDPRLVRARRFITRSASLGGEDYEGVDDACFDNLRSNGAFALDWRAHGMSYGIPAEIDDAMRAGRDVLVNLSRAALPAAAGRPFPLEVLLLAANRDVLKQRLLARGRESTDEIEARLDRAAFSLPHGLRVHEIDNSGRLDEAADRALECLYPVEAVR